MSDQPTMRQFKLGVFVSERLHAGGGYQQSLNAALLTTRLCLPGWSVTAFTPHAETKDLLNSLGLSAVLVPLSRVAEAMLSVRRRVRRPGLLRRVRRLFGANGFERAFEDAGVDLVYFTSPSDLALDLERTNFLLTVWDLCHRDELEFPEVRADREFEKREQYYREVLPKAVAVFSDSELGTANLVRRYALDPARVRVLRSSPSMQTAPSAGDVADVDIRARFGIDGDYVFYPAQFWAHKNHVYVLQAMALLKQRHNVQLHAVFAGGDAGGMQAHVRSMAESLGLIGHVHLAGFVPDTLMAPLYSQALALVMPTYFGPTNLPPLEALRLGTPVVYPSVLAAASGLSDVVYGIDLADPATLSDALHALVLSRRAGQPRVDAEQVAKVLSMLDDDDARRRTLESVLTGYAQRRACWP